MSAARKILILSLTLILIIPAAETHHTHAQEASAMQSGDTIVSIDFDDGGTDGFAIYTNGGSCEISNEDGALAVDLYSCGSLDYANQVYWDGFKLVQGCEYTYSFDISCDISRQVRYRLQLNGGDYHAYHSGNITVGPDPVHIEEDWTMAEATDPAPRIVFNMGYMDDMASDPGQHRILIDNISLTVKDASGAAAAEAMPDPFPPVSLSQVGYLPDQPKYAVVREDSEEARFTIFDASTDQAVYEGTFDAPMYDHATDARVKRGDFTSFTTPGIYYIRVESGNLKDDSYPFTIGDDVFDELFRSAVRMLTLQRCGTALEQSLAGSFSHDVCHTQQAVIYGTDQMVDVSGGWHDAGDYGRYVVSGAKAAADLMMAWAYFGADMDDTGIPESGNGIPDVLDEARYELDWMLKMQDEKTGGVYHKVTGYAFPGVIMPDEDHDPMVIAPVSTTATGDFAAVMARASAVYKTFDPDFSARALEAARKAWNYIKDTEDSTGFLNPDGISTGEYPDRGTNDERFWAAAELYLAGEKDMVQPLLEIWQDYSLRPGLGWARMTSYAMYDLLLAASGNAADSMDMGDLSDLLPALKDALVKEADTLLSASEKDVFHMSLEKNYPWGSNMTVANNGIALLLSYELTGEQAYADLAEHQLSYLLGANGPGYCFVTGFGSRSPQDPHHRPSQSVGSAMPGMLVGGPDSSLEDPYAKGVLIGLAPALCYVDSDQSYSCNETAVYWNSPLICLLAGIY